MSLLYKRLETITEDDLQSLIGLTENRFLECKQELPNFDKIPQKTIQENPDLKNKVNDEKAEFLADISAFANADGEEI